MRRSEEFKTNIGSFSSVFRQQTLQIEMSVYERVKSSSANLYASFLLFGAQQLAPWVLPEKDQIRLLQLKIDSRVGNQPN